MTKFDSLLIAGAGFVIVAFTGKVAVLLGMHDEPLGFDGYYYVAQVNSLLCGNGLAYPTHTPLVFLPQVALSWIVGNPVHGIKLSVLLTAISFAVCEIGLLHSLAPKRLTLLGLALPLLFSYPILLFVVEFLKNLLGLVFVLLALIRLERLSTDTRSSRDPGLIALLVLAGVSHYLTAILALLIFLAALVADYLRDRRRQERFVLFLIPPTFFAVGLVVVLVGTALWGMGSLRWSGHLGSHPGLLVLPVMVALLACSFGAPEDRSNSRHARTPSPGGIARGILGGAGAFLAPLAALKLTDFVDQSVDRAMLSLFLLLGGSAAIHILPDRGGWRKWLAAASLLGIPALFAPGFPDGVALSSRYSGVRSQEEVDLKEIIGKGVVVAPHGIDYLLSYRFGIRSGHDDDAYEDSPLYWFIWKSACLATPELCDRSVFLDLGEGGVISDATLRRFAAERK